ncbi:chorismate mutase [Asticcacaulis sp. ZE23SCel15]|uniref:chorismate mutase n=1 Tax=Asticcacaulis sp. ZE23SCel15 TaxID=3059027 RepID=UPI00265DD30D|nr:chorismate mutase [Asticcacaulis sp. ZE23SCel15]WKL58855.1 chorismate mutase [Asticcacaulis sp. ZE23SCel15]
MTITLRVTTFSVNAQTPQPAEAPSLESLRKRIDQIDADLLRLVDTRASLAEAIATAKAHEAAVETVHRERVPAEHISLLRPDREALLIRKLLSAPGRKVSDAVIIRIWRELISESLRIQGADRGGLHLNLWAGDKAEVMLWARQRFGAAPALSQAADPVAAILAARDPRHVGVISLDPKGGAWWARLLAEPHVRVMAALPEDINGRPQALGVASLQPEPTGNDVTFWVTDYAGADHKLSDILSQRGLIADAICQASGLKLWALTGYVQEDDDRLSGFSSLSGVIGAAARIY